MNPIIGAHLLFPKNLYSLRAVVRAERPNFERQNDSIYQSFWCYRKSVCIAHFPDSLGLWGRTYRSYWYQIDHSQYGTAWLSFASWGSWSLESTLWLDLSTSHHIILCRERAWSKWTCRTRRERPREMAGTRQRFAHRRRWSGTRSCVLHKLQNFENCQLSR